MKKKDVLELKRRLTKNDCTFSRICGCYVDGDGNIVTMFGETFLNLPDEEFYKYLDIAKGIFKGKLKDNMLNLELSEEAKEENDMQQFLLAIRDSGLKDENLLETFYDRVIDNYDHVGNYLILLYRTWHRRSLNEKSENTLEIRYLKNKDTMVYENKTAAEVVMQIANNFNFNLGTIADTIWKIASRVEDNESLMDMIGNALDLTLQNTGDLYILHDDGGKLNLSFIGDMYVPIVIDAETGQNYDYESSIDSDTYNRIKLVFDNEKTGKRDVYIAQDSSHMNDWGILQYFDTLQDGENGQAKADALLKLYNKATKTLTIKDACGDSRVRGGSLVVVQLDLGDVQIKNLMLVEKCVHKYGESKHTMDLTLSGGGFSA